MTNEKLVTWLVLKHDPDFFCRSQQRDVGSENKPRIVLGPFVEGGTAELRLGGDRATGLFQQAVDVVHVQPKEGKAQDGAVLHMNNIDIAMGYRDVWLRHNQVNSPACRPNDNISEIEAILENHVTFCEQRLATSPQR